MLYWVLKWIFIGPWLRVLFRPWTHNLDVVPREGGGIFVSNHLSFSDSFFLPLVTDRRVTFLAKQEYFEGKGIKAGLTGNIEELLSALINGMVAEGLAYKSRRGEPIDWSDPVQYPFVLAVYGRKHAKIKVPLALGLEPIFAEAVKRLNTCRSSWDTLEVAKWVFDQLNNVNTKPEDEPVQPPTNPTPPSDDEGEDEGEDGGDGGKGDDETGSGGDSEQPTGGDQGGDAPTPKPDPAKPPTKDGETVKAREVEPTANPPEGAGSGGSYSTDDVMRKGYHTRADNPRTFPIDF